MLLPQIIDICYVSKSAKNMLLLHRFMFQDTSSVQYDHPFGQVSLQLTNIQLFQLEAGSHRRFPGTREFLVDSSVQDAFHRPEKPF